jgi:nucleotide-binding universal stress UspA family protein
MTAPILAAYCPQTDDRGPVVFAASAARAAGTQLIIASVHAGATMVDIYSVTELADQPEERAQLALEQLRADLGDDDPIIELRAVEALTPARGISALIEEAHPALVVLGSTRRGILGRTLPGSTAERVIHGADCPVAVVPTGYGAPAGGLETIGAGFIPTVDGHEALRAATVLARAAGARVRALTVLNPGLAGHQTAGMLALHHHDQDTADEVAGRLRRDAMRSLSEAIAALPHGAEVELDVLFQDPVDGLVAASRQLDLLVMGSRAYGPLGTVMLGGVSARVIARAACPVLVLPRGTESAVDSLVQAAIALSVRD